MRASALGLLGAATLTLTACGGGGGGNGSSDALDYWLWDANQLPAYEQCAADFTESTGIDVNINQMGWDDYWSSLTNGFVAGTAPDVFTNHLSRYPEFVANSQLLSLDDVEATASVDTSIYNEGLAELWVAQDGKRYGLPKDWDTVAIFYNEQMIADAGYSAEDLENLTWNPEDGGTYEDLIARLSVDQNGVRGDEDGFDPNNVAVYGLGLPGAGEGHGQTEWSYFTATTGWTHTDENPWGTHYNYDDPDFQQSMDWYASLVDKGYMPPLETTVGASMPDTFAAGKSAINVNGSWMIGQYTGYEGVDVSIAPTPVGPTGERASMFNGLADSIYAGTDQPEEAAQLVAYLGSADCQSVVAEAAVVFPAVSSAMDQATEAFADNGVDVSAFTTHVEDGTTFMFPITDHAAQIDGIMAPAMDAVVSGKAPASSLTEANEKVNALFE
ncbi:sugar ABC transporter substrate-binding protein [Zhihengliuella somnathii]